MQNKTILWVEDDIDIIKPVIYPLLTAGFQIIGCQTYAEALTHIQDLHEYDLILLDLILPPGKSDVKGEYLGLEFLRRLRREFDIQIPVIVFSVVANAPNISEEIKSLGAIPLHKPIRPSDLKYEVFDILGIKS
jgi:CheY-like chemotaxis protein